MTELTCGVGPILDLGCGPGHATNLLRQLGASATGVDRSPSMVEEARQQYPMCKFVAADFCHLPYEDSSIAGIVGLYAIVNLTQEIVTSAFAEMYRVLKTPGCLLISFHAGHEQLTVDNFLSTGESLWFQMFDPVDVIELLRQAGFESINCLVRDAYAQEYPTKRCYIRARKAE